MGKEVSLGLLSSASGGRAAVALVIDGEIKESRLCGTGRRASEELLPTVDELLKDNDLIPSQITAIAASRGPGSFTGIRVGLATMMGLCRATKAQPKAYSTLWLMAFSAQKPGTIISLIPAGRGDIFVGTFEMTDGELTESKDPFILFKKEQGDFSFENATVIVEKGWEVPDNFGEYIEVGTEECARLAALMAGKSDGPTFPLEPLYLRRSWAEEAKESREQR